MAENTVILRPSADISIEHVKKHPDTLPEHYLAINETICDGEETYIGIDYNSDGIDRPVTSKFALDNIMFENAVDVKKVKIVIVCWVWGQMGTSSEDDEYTGNVGCKLFNNEILLFESEKYKTSETMQTYTFEATNVSEELNNYFNANKTYPNLTLEITTTVFTKGSNKSSDRIKDFITQAYVEIEYSEYGKKIYQKKNNDYKLSKAFFRKQFGSWSEISEDEAKAILTSNTIRRE